MLRKAVLMLAFLCGHALADGPAAKPALVFKTPDGKLQLELSDEWKEKQLPLTPKDSFSCAAANPRKQLAVVLTYQSEDKPDLANFADSMWEYMRRSMPDLIASDPSVVKVAGHDAIQFQVTGTPLNRAKSAEIISFIATEGHVTTLTVTCFDISRFDKAKDDMKSLADQLKAQNDGPAHSPVGTAFPQLILKTPDKRIQLTLPEGWHQMKSPATNAGTVFFLAGTARKPLTVMLGYVADEKHNVAGEANSLWDGMRTSMPDLKVSAPANVKVAGHDSLQYEVTGTASGNQKIAQIVTFIPTEGHTVEISVTCFGAELFDALKETMKSLPDGLKDAPH